jgi:NDP-sugar pyrophosphorylase family protein
LAVQERKSTRYLLFDQNLQLCGRKTAAKREAELAQAPSQPKPLAFSGIHVISPRLLPMITEEGVFSIIDPYLRLAARGEKIIAFRADEYRWRDLGRLEDVTQADRELRQTSYPSPKQIV